MADREAWLRAGEDRLRFKEALLKVTEKKLQVKGAHLPGARITPVVGVKCSNCSQMLSSQAMKVYHKGASEIDVYCTNEYPNCITEERRYVDHDQCGCKVRTFNCQCGVRVGYTIDERCSQCSAHNEEDDAHRWFFESSFVDTRPLLDDNGRQRYWPAPATVNGQDSSIEESSGRQSSGSAGQAGYFDENSIVQAAATSPWNCSPLADRNGRPRQSLDDKAAKPCPDMGKQSGADFQAREEELIQYQVSLNLQEQNIKQSYQRLMQFQVALETRERTVQAQEKQQAQGADQATKCALQRAEQRAANCEAEAEALRIQLVEAHRMANAAEEKLSSKNQEIEQVRSTLAELRREARKNGLTFLPGVGNMVPPEEASSSEQSLKGRIKELEQELSCERAELVHTRRELQIARATGRRELEGFGAGDVRTYLKGSTLEPPKSTTTKPSNDEDLQKRLEIVADLSRRRMELDRREQALDLTDLARGSWQAAARK
jgi:hypothetical protein